MKYKLSKKHIQNLNIGEQITYQCDNGQEYSAIKRYAYRLRSLLKRNDGAQFVVSSSKKDGTVIIAVEAMVLG